MTHSEPSQISKTELFAKSVNGWKPLKKIEKSSILDWLGSEHAPKRNDHYRAAQESKLILVWWCTTHEGS